ncbi:S-acyltransferase [Raphidocelis subcapitata]|uniref:S-acyltransferase n=1 Tax=Raphidocelis subcapitata TaxID=307507 RepID=A0A2V0P7K4_9CHLO|nr:S-acyltransferase [Raphidocelis subcapitata]|eukprot:GBF95841.1 S-acyltransferase [Raphidocelis subcapitata]
MDSEPRAAGDGGVAQCWGCGALVTVPLVDGAAAPLYRCGWCGAINDGAAAGGAAAPPRPGPAARALAAAARAGRWLVVALVVAVIASVGALGVGVVLPRAFPSPLACAAHSAFALTLLAFTSVHYVAACARSPGRVQDQCPPPRPDAAGRYPEGAFEGWTRCRHASCRAARPPGAHHCSTCGVCVVDLDHHCPFVNNCVGANNLRPFLLLLLCLLAASAYALAVTGGLIAAHWPRVRAGMRAAGAAAREYRQRRHGGGGAGGGPAGPPGGPRPPWHERVSDATTLLVAASPWWLLAAYYLFAMCSAVLVCVGVLLVGQLRYMAAGTTYVDALQGRPHARPSWRVLWARLRAALADDASSGGGGGGGGGGGSGGTSTSPPKKAR